MTVSLLSIFGVCRQKSGTVCVIKLRYTELLTITVPRIAREFKRLGGQAATGKSGRWKLQSFILNFKRLLWSLKNGGPTIILYNILAVMPEELIARIQAMGA
jgi:hypothetical protein